MFNTNTNADNVTYKIMSNNKQSSVEWLYNKMYEHRGNITIEEFEQAKAMHKEEMIQSYSNGWHDGQDIIINGIAHIQVGGDAAGQEYYNETFGGEK